MTIGEVGASFFSTEKFIYRSDRTFIDFDFLILDYAAILKDQLESHGAVFMSRKDGLKEFIDHRKGPLIIFAPNPMAVKFMINGQNPHMSALLPISPFAVAKESGQVMSIVPSTPFASFFSKYLANFHYTSYFKNFTGKTLIEVPLTKKVIAFYNEECVVLPPLKQPFDKGEEREFLKELIDIVSTVRKNPGQIALPNWALNYQLPGEGNILTEIENLKEQRNNIVNKLTEKEILFEEIERKKLLFTSSGNELEGEIEKLFRELGFEILEAEEGRDDLIVKFGDAVAVVEIKGVTGTSAEKHAAQLEKWVTTYYERTDVKPKGILLVNSHRETVLESRTQDTFPHQMLKFSMQREHCLLSTVQLLGLYFEIKEDESKKENLIQELLSTVGVYNKFNNWQKFISKK